MVLHKSRNLFQFVSVLPSASVERVGVSRMRDFLSIVSCPLRVCSTHLSFTLLSYRISVSSLVRAARMAALPATGATVLNNIYTEKSEKYLNCKNYDVTTIAKDRATGELIVKSQIPHCQLASYFSKSSSQDARNSTSVLAEDKKHLFPKMPRKIQDITSSQTPRLSFSCCHCPFQISSYRTCFHHPQE